MFKASKVAILGGVLAAAVSTAPLADPMWYDIGTVGDPGTGDADTYSRIFQQFQLFANTTTLVTDVDASTDLSLGDTFTDAGDAVLTALLPSNSDNEGNNNTWEFTVAWTGLTGHFTTNLTHLATDNNVINFAYNGGTTFTFYYDAAFNNDFGATNGTSDDTGFTDGTKVLEVTLDGGTGSFTFDDAGNLIASGSTFSGKVTFALDNLFYFDNGDNTANPLSDLDFHDLLAAALQITASVDQNTDDLQVTPGGANGAFLTIDSNHDGSLDFTKAPEPGTLAMLGFGLAGLGVLRRRKAA